MCMCVPLMAAVLVTLFPLLEWANVEVKILMASLSLNGKSILVMVALTLFFCLDSVKMCFCAYSARAHVANVNLCRIWYICLYAALTPRRHLFLNSKMIDKNMYDVHVHRNATKFVQIES